jgi:phosphate transport system substrate-binding protein
MLLVSALFCLATPGPASAAQLDLVETGSTLMAPLLKLWTQAYQTVAPDVHVATAGTDSGAGIAAAIDGTAQIGASDAYMSDVEMLRHPDILNIPLAISAQVVLTNLPDVAAPLRLSGPVLAGIYSGTITDWSDPRIAALNPGVTLPHHTIVPIRRSDTSGDTFLFTQFLTFSTPDWESGPGYGTSVSWPQVAATKAVAGNDGMVQTLAQTPYGVAYVGASYADAAADKKLTVALLRNEAGNFVAPTPADVTEAAARLTPRTPADERLTLAFAPGADAYPLINYEYAIVRQVQPNPAQAQALRDFLLWSITPGQGDDPKYLAQGHFIALPTSIRALSESQIAKIR